MSELRQKKICYLGNAASVHTVRWANYFAEQDWSIDLITWHPPLGGTTGGINPKIRVHRILFPPHYTARYFALLEIACLMKKIRPDVIHGHYLSHFGILAGLYNRFFGFRPVVLTAWGSDVLVDAKGWKRPLIKDALKRADCVTCDADHIVAELEKLGASKEKIKLIYFGTDCKKFRPGLDGRKIKEKLNLADSPVVISVRSLRPMYDVESLIKAVPLVLKEQPEARFVIGGDGEQRGYLQNMADSLGVAGSVRFAGLIANDELPQYLNASDIYVSTSLSDAGLSASTAEAMACGLPVVITDFGDNRKWVEDGVSGFVVPMKNPEVLAEKIIYLIKNRGKGREFGKAGRQVIEERNNREREMEKMDNIYRQLIERYKK